MATSLEEAAELLELAETSPGLLVCAPHILLSPTFRAVHGAVREGRVGELLTARARYGWAGPWWSEWFYEPGGGSLFDLGVYNVTSLCALFGPARRVTAMVGVAIPEREVNGRRIRVEADDNAHVLLDFGDARFAVVTTGFTMQRYRSPAIEVYGSEGTIQLLGDDWAPEGWELWRNADGAWRVSPSPIRTGSGPRACAISSTASRPGGPTSRGPEHALPRARDHARRPGRRPRRRRAHDRERLPRPRLRRRVRSSSTRSGSPTTAGATMGYKPSPRPSFDGADGDPRGRCRAAHLGRRGGGLRRGLDLRLVAADPRDRVRASSPAARSATRRASGRCSPPTSCSTCCRGRSCSPTRRPARSSAPSPARASSSAATPGITASPTATSRCGCSSSSRRRRRPAHRARTRRRGRTSSESVYAVEGVVGNLADAVRRRARCALLRREDSAWRLDRDVLVGLLVSTEHLTAGTVTVPAGQTSLEEAHDGEELVYVTRGELRVEAAGVEATLAPGDAFFVPSATSHRYARDGRPASPRRSSASLRAGSRRPRSETFPTPGGGVRRPA